MKKSTTDFLCRCLRTVPLATCNILKLLPSSISKEIYHIVLMELLDDFSVQNFNAILAILFNSKLDILELEILPKLAKLMNNTELSQLSIAFINDKIRDRLISTEDRLCVDDLISKRRLFVQAIVDNKHFIEPLINHNAISDTTLSNDALKESVFLVKMLVNFEQFQLDDHKKYLEIINQLSTINSPNNTFKCNVLNELQRLFNLKELLIHIPNIRINASKFNVIDILYENMNLSKIDSQLVHSVLNENSKFNHRFNLIAKENNNQLTEMELYNNFLIVKSLLEVILDNPAQLCVSVLNESSLEKLKQVQLLLQNVSSIKTFINIVDIVFSLIFIRWDNFTHNGSVDLDRTSESESEIGEYSKSHKRSKRNEKTAFICSASVLDNLINLLRNVSQQKFQSEAFVNADDSDKKSFRRLYENINDAHWRVLLFYSNVTMSTSRSTSFVNDDIKKYFNKHQSDTRDSSNVSSDEEINSQQVTSVYRRKPRKKNPSRKSADEKSLVISNSTEQEQRSDTLYRSISASERRCPVSRMLGSPEHLATVCLNNGNVEATKEIVKVG